MLLSQDGTALITDFGLSRAQTPIAQDTPLIAGDQSLLVSRGGMTPGFASPEQLRGDTLTRGTDVWSWAASVLSMFTGGVTWEVGPAAGEALEEYLKTDQPAMPDGLATVLRGCFTWDPEQRPSDLSVMATELQEIYADVTSQPHQRELPAAVKHLADGLNNRALSMLDLGRPDEAVRLWDEALEADLHHPHATYNRGLHQWRVSQLTDDELVRQLEAVRTTHEGDWVDEYLLGLVHLERGDKVSALPLLEQAVQHAPEDAEVSQALAEARRPADAVDIKTFETYPGVSAVALTPDGRVGLVGTYGGGVQVWDLDGGQPVANIDSGPGRTEAVAISVDGRKAIIVSTDIHALSNDMTVQIWDLSQQRCRLAWTLPHDAPANVAVSAECDRALTSASGVLQLWDLRTGERVTDWRVRNEHDSRNPRPLLPGEIRPEIQSIAMTSDGRIGLVSKENGAIQVWDLEAGRVSVELPGHDDAARHTAITPDGSHALTGNNDGDIRLWDLEQGSLSSTLKGEIGVAGLALTADCQFGISSAFSKIYLWDLSSSRNLFSQQLERMVPTSEVAGAMVTAGSGPVALTPDGRRAVAGGGHTDGGDVMLITRSVSKAPISAWSYARPRSTGLLASVIERAESALAAASTHLEGGRGQAAADELRTVRQIQGFERDPRLRELWGEAGRAGARKISVNGAWIVREIAEDFPPQVPSAQIPEGGLALFAGWEGLRLWDLRSGDCVKTLSDSEKGRADALAVTSDGRLAFAADGGRASVWDLASGQKIAVLRDPAGFGSVAMTRDGRFGVSGGARTGEIRLWDLRSGRMLRELGSHAQGVGSIAITPNGDRVLSCGFDGRLLVWDPTRGGVLKVLQGAEPNDATNRSVRVCVRADGNYAITTRPGNRIDATDGQLQLWNLDSGLVEHTIEVGAAYEVSMSLDGQLAIVGETNGRIRLWHIQSGSCLATLEGHPSQITSVAITRDLRFVLSSSADSTLRLWELDWEYEYPDETDWDEGARPFLGTFLSSQSLDNGRRLDRLTWIDEGFEGLMDQLKDAGYGWLRPSGVLSEVQRMAERWDDALGMTGVAMNDHEESINAILTSLGFDVRLEPYAESPISVSGVTIQHNGIPLQLVLTGGVLVSVSVMFAYVPDAAPAALLRRLLTLGGTNGTYFKLWEGTSEQPASFTVEASRMAVGIAQTDVALMLDNVSGQFFDGAQQLIREFQLPVTKS